jgi:hypothetical protein
MLKAQDQKIHHVPGKPIPQFNSFETYLPIQRYFDGSCKCVDPTVGIFARILQGMDKN